MTKKKLNKEPVGAIEESLGAIEENFEEDPLSADPMEVYKALPNWVGPPKRRKFTRRDANYVVLETTGRAENWVATCVSMGGIFCPDVKRKKGSTLQLKILFPDGSPPIFASGKVAYCRTIGPRVGVGVKFTFPQARLGHGRFHELNKNSEKVLT